MVFFVFQENTLFVKIFALSLQVKQNCDANKSQNRQKKPIADTKNSKLTYILNLLQNIRFHKSYEHRIVLFFIVKYRN